MKKILVIGSLNMDQVMKVHHIPAPGETILCKDMQLVCGGKGANQAFTCGRLGCNVEMIGCVGMDDNGDSLIDNLRHAGVETGCIQKEPNEPTGLAVIAVEEAGNNSIMVMPGANMCVNEAFILNNLSRIKGADAIVLQLEIPLESVALAAKEAKKAGKLVILDPAPATQLSEDLYKCVDILKPNETELSQLSGLPVQSLDEVETAARTLLKQGVKNVVVTLGSEGAMIVSNDKTIHVPGHDVEVVDTTAAGDSFTASMTMQLVEGYELEKSVAYAVGVSAVVVTRPGAQSSIPTAIEVEQIKKSGFKKHEFCL